MGTTIKGLLLPTAVKKEMISRGEISWSDSENSWGNYSEADNRSYKRNAVTSHASMCNYRYNFHFTIVPGEPKNLGFTSIDLQRTFDQVSRDLT